MYVIEDAEDVKELVLLFDATRREQLLSRLRGYGRMRDKSAAHELADAALLDYIEDPKVSEAFDAIFDGEA